MCKLTKIFYNVLVKYQEAHNKRFYYFAPYLNIRQQEVAAK